MVVQRENLADLLCVMCVFLFQQNGSLAEKKHAREPMRTLLLVPCAQGGVMHSLGRSLGRAEEPNIVLKMDPGESCRHLRPNLYVKMYFER